MPYTPRCKLLQQNTIFHVTWKCINSEYYLSSNHAKQLYYDTLLTYLPKYGIKFFSYCFMDNHVHLTGVCESQKEFSDYFRAVHSVFARKMNAFLGRHGTFVMDRIKSQVIESEQELHRVMLYNDLNPSRTTAKLHPRKFKFSSFHHYAGKSKDPLISTPEFYLEFGSNDVERARYYCTLIDELFSQDPLIQQCVYKDKFGRYVTFIGSKRWIAKQRIQLRDELIDRELHRMSAWQSRFGETWPV